MSDNTSSLLSGGSSSSSSDDSDDSEEGENNVENNENKEGEIKEGENKEEVNKEGKNIEDGEKEEGKEDQISKSSKIREIKLKNNNEKKSSKSQSNKESLRNQENNFETGNKNEQNNIIEKDSNNQSKRDSNNKFYIHQSNDRMLTLMDVSNEDYSYKKDNRKKEELILLKEKVKLLEERNLKLESMNKIYYDIIKEINLDNSKNNINNKNTLQFQSLDSPNDNISNIHQNYLNNISGGNLEFAIQNFINGERNKNIHNFNDSMMDINKKITNYLIDNCQEQKDKNRRLENFKYEIGQKLDRIEKIQIKQKHDIDFIIKYGINKNRALDPIVGLLNDYQRPLPKLLKELDEEYKYDKFLNEKNLVPYKNFYLHGRYSNLDKKEDISDKKNENGKILKRTGSCIFENRKNPFTYKLKENEVYNKDYPNIRSPFFENKKSNFKRNNINDYNDEEEEYQKFIAYKGKYFIPSEFRFGRKIENNLEDTRPKKNKIKKEIDFIF